MSICNNIQEYMINELLNFMKKSKHKAKAIKIPEPNYLVLVSAIKPETLKKKKK